MSAPALWQVPGDAVRSLTLALTPGQVGELLASGDREDGPGPHGESWQDRVGVVVDGQPRSGWLTDLLGGPVDPVRPGACELILTPLVHAPLGRGFTTCGWGWVATGGPLVGGQQVDLADPAGRHGPFRAQVAADSEPAAGRFWTLLHIQHDAGVPVATVDASTASIAAAAGDPADPGSWVADVRPGDLISAHAVLGLGQPVELLTRHGVRTGVAEAVDHQGDGLHYRIHLTGDDLVGRDPTSGWHPSGSPQPAVRADRLTATLSVTADGAIGQVVGTVRFHAGLLELARVPLDTVALAAASIVTLVDTGPPTTPATVTQMLRLAVQAFARDWDLPVAGDQAALWAHPPLAAGIFPLHWPTAPDGDRT